eukprot:3064981-Amphidinium_carterae.1
MLLITLDVIPIFTALCVGVSQKVMSEISQKIKRVIRMVISVTTQRNQAKVKTGKSGKSARDFLMVAEQVMFKGLNKAGINAVRLNVKDFLPQKFKGDRNQFKPWADEVMLFLSVEEPRVTAILKSLQTTHQPITDAD